ncbi:MAG: hypothetical protein U1F77_00335 [Kiritimatiellia bacterium]
MPEILKLEQKGLYFAPDFKRSILHSVAPPGASQHIALLALDITEHDNPRVRQILAAHGWFQTIPSTSPLHLPRRHRRPARPRPQAAAGAVTAGCRIIDARPL